MTFKDLKLHLSKLQPIGDSRLAILRNKPFWIWSKEQHKHEYQRTNGKCCFNHICKCPVKNGIEFPLFDYQKGIYDLLLSNSSNDIKAKHLWIKKATGIGVTEFMLRLMAWLCTRNNDHRNSQMCIVTGPNIDIAIKLIKRLKAIFEPKLDIMFDNKETVLELNGCTIEAYPSNHLDSYRALDSPKFILIDEADFFRKSEQDDVRHVSERYIGKSDPYIVMVSTPNKPDGLFERLDKELEASCIYKRLKLGYEFGLNKIYTNEEIEKARASPSFEREYNLQYLGKIGNVFSPMQIDKAIELGELYKTLPVNPYNLHSAGIDVGFGSSNTAITVTEILKDQNKIRIIYSKEFDNHASPSFIANRVYELYQKIPNTYFFVDGSARGSLQSVKLNLVKK